MSIRARGSSNRRGIYKYRLATGDTFYLRYKYMYSVLGTRLYLILIKLGVL
jgi:hypothetical protein